MLFFRKDFIMFYAGTFYRLVPALGFVKNIHCINFFVKKSWHFCIIYAVTRTFDEMVAGSRFLNVRFSVLLKKWLH